MITGDSRPHVAQQHISITITQPKDSVVDFSWLNHDIMLNCYCYAPFEEDGDSQYMYQHFMWTGQGYNNVTH